MNILCIIQARMNSTRLPGKVLRKISGVPMLLYLLRRLKQSKYINKIVVATSNQKTDDILYKYCIVNNIEVFRGSLNNVLNRFYQTAVTYKADIVIRITADCPLLDSHLLDRGIKSFLRIKPDHLSNTIKRTYPRGFDFEIMPFKTLKNAFLHANKELELEHVTPYIYLSASNKFKIFHYVQKQNLSKYQLSVDTKRDFILIKTLVTKYKAHLLDHQEITKIIIKNPKLQYINQRIKKI